MCSDTAARPPLPLATPRVAMTTGIIDTPMSTAAPEGATAHGIEVKALKYAYPGACARRERRRAAPCVARAHALRPAACVRVGELARPGLVVGR